MIRKVFLTLFFLLILATPVSAQENVQTVTPGQSGQAPETTDDEGENDPSRIGSYKPLAKLPGIPPVIDPGLETGGEGSFTLPMYIKTLVRIAIGVIGILAVIMIVISGIQYMATGMVSEKEGAKQKLTGAVFGLILAVSSVLLLRTVNPQLVELDIGRGVLMDCTQKRDASGNLLYFANYTDLDKKTDKDTITQKKGKDGKMIFVDSAGKTVDATSYVQYENQACYKTTIESVALEIPEDLEISGGNDYLKTTANYTGSGPNVKTNIPTYDSYFKSAAQEFGVSCTALKAHAYAESTMNPDAVSPKGATGLIQVMPKTFNGLKKEKPDLAGDLKDPKVNTRVAAYYMKQLLSQACGPKSHPSCTENPYSRFVTAAYNGGPGINFSGTCGKTKWECREFYSKKGTNNETIVYVDRVWANIQVLKTNGWGCD